MERVLEPARRDPFGRAVDRQQRDDLAGRACQRARAADHREPVAVEVRIDRGARVTGVAEQQDRAEQVVEPAAGVADHEDVRGLERDRSVERELEVGRVLRGRVPLDHGARRLGGCEPGRRDRVEVADRAIDAEPERECPVDARVGRDHVRALGQLGHATRGGMPSGNDDDCLDLHAHTSAGITQIRFCGSAAR